MRTYTYSCRPDAIGAGSTSPSLRVRFFGRFTLSRDDEVVSLGRSTKALAIFKYLLSHRAQPVSQDYLMSWLWPESDLEKARWSLNSSIYTLRKFLKGELSSVASSNYILFDKGYYRLDPAIEVWTDAGEFEARYERGCHLGETQRQMEAAAEYEKAIELYRGDYLVEDLYEDWTMIERQRFASMHIGMLGWLARYYMETKRYQESIQTCYRLLEEDHCHEESHRLLMECFIRLGLRRRALHQYRFFEAALKRDWGTTPQPEIRDLYQRISGQQASSIEGPMNSALYRSHA